MEHPVAGANEKSPFGSLTPAEFYARHSVTHSSQFITNSRGLKLFTQWWIPSPPTKILGTVAVVHGYTSDCTWTVQLTAVLFAKSGFATCGIDHQGHGHSEGLSIHIPDINPVVDDCISFFDSFRARHDPSLPSFLYGESLGGAIALLIALRHGGGGGSRAYAGIVLNGAMCGVSDKFKPPWPLVHFLPIVAALVPTWEVVPTTGSLPDLSFKEESKRKLAFANPRWRLARPRAATARECLRFCRELQSKFAEVEVPFLIIHGGEDVVCDPVWVEELYKQAASKDKTLRMFPGMWHQLIGEPDDNVELVFGGVVEWLRVRAERAASSGGGEVETAVCDGGA